MAAVAFGLTVAFSFSGCSRQSDMESKTGVSRTFTVTHVGQTFTLTTNAPLASITGHLVRLLSIADDGTTVLTIVGSNQTLMARVGEPFSNSPFGSHGLTLESASRAEGKVVLIRHGAESR